MKRNPGITAINSRTSFSKRMLQKFVRNGFSAKAMKTNSGKNRNQFSDNYEAIDWSSGLVPIDGRLDILFEAKHPEAISRISIPVQSVFLVTCTKEGSGSYKLTWSCSMT
jgi:hypothetical protein